jgi:hypothetical protein
MDKGKENRKKRWLEDLDKYCLKHKITRKQFASIFRDTDYEHDYRSLHWSSGETDDWMWELNTDKDEVVSVDKRRMSQVLARVFIQKYSVTEALKELGFYTGG